MTILHYYYQCVVSHHLFLEQRWTNTKYSRFLFSHFFFIFVNIWLGSGRKTTPRQPSGATYRWRRTSRCRRGRRRRRRSGRRDGRWSRSWWTPGHTGRTGRWWRRRLQRIRRLSDAVDAYRTTDCVWQLRLSIFVAIIFYRSKQNVKAIDDNSIIHCRKPQCWKR